jgi:hypothetical protein
MKCVQNFFSILRIMGRFHMEDPGLYGRGVLKWALE